MVLIVAVAVGTMPAAAGAQAPRAAPVATQQEAADDDAALELAQRHAPVVMLAEQEVECDAEREQYRPSAVEVMLDNPQIALRQVSREDPVFMRGPSASDLFELGDGFYLDAPGGPLTPRCTYERDFARFSADQPDVVYAHVVQQDDVADRVYVQYWLYWYFNDWNNKHEGDWEGIVLEFEAASPAEALETEPTRVGYSQHEGGEQAGWDDDRLQRDGDHPVVYPSAGSHASYFGAAVYLGRGPSEGFGCDTTAGPHERVEPEVVLLPTEVTDPESPLAWLAFDGRWGERQAGPFNGPTGPTDKDRWLRPADWFTELRTSSVVIPAGDSGASALADVFCGVVEAGSGVLILAALSPALVILALLILVGLIVLIAGRTDWSRVPTYPLIRRRRIGQIIRGAGAIYRQQPLALVASGLVYLPAALLTGLAIEVLEMLPGVRPFLSLVRRSDGANIVLALTIGSLANLIAFTITSGMVADHLAMRRHGLGSMAESARATWMRRRELAGAIARAIVIVVVLVVSVVGIPWAIWKLVQFQLIAQSATFDRDVTPMRRSVQLVRGRWFHTAMVVVIVNGLVVAAAVTVSLLLLTVVTSIPLWAFAGVEAIVFALTVPLAAAAMTLLYGDAVAAEREEPALVAAE